MIGCPACSGVLQVQNGPHGHQQFVCSVGHAFGTESLYYAKEEELEQALWSATALLEHLTMVLNMFDEQGQPFLREDALRHRLRQIERHRVKIRSLIEETKLPEMEANP